ncbi:MAG: efflux RND transporter periplasmic adaptor subunit [Phycisphaerales bacterium]|nr:efflux RND transporter periplasmic adaptor subunit [Phycisphaerales bacterium]MCI0675069.1 efflux RND transporter periplasmic adaptor subunit [Phycisphaerales bacterium]
MTFFRIAHMTAVTLAIVGCSGGGDSANESASATQAAPPPTNRVDIPQAVRKNLGITFAKVEKRRIGQTVRVPGSFELLPKARQEYRATLPGRVEFLVEQYQSVEAGTPLYRMQSPGWHEVQRELSEALYAIEAARSDIAVSEATLNETESRIKLQEDRIATLAQAEVRRAELEVDLAEMSASLPRLRTELDAKRSTLAAVQDRFDHGLNRAAAILGMTREGLAEYVPHNGHSGPRWQIIDWIDVRASQPGIVESIALTPGGWAETASLVLTTANPQLVRFRGLGLQADLARLRSGAPATIIPPNAGGGNGSTLEPITAELTIGLEADPAERTVALLATPKTLADWTRPGVSAFLEIETAGTGTEEMVIPRSAIVQDGLAHIVFRRDPANPDKVIRMEADLGLSDGRWSVINSGVRVGDEVVLNGVYELKLATSSTAQKGGHFHADGTFHAEGQ